MEAKNVLPTFATFAKTRGRSAPNARMKEREKDLLAEDKISDTKRVIEAVS
jgi:hypothetical protein